MTTECRDTAEHLRRVAVEARPPDHGHGTRAARRKSAASPDASLQVRARASRAPLHLSSWTVSVPVVSIVGKRA